MDAFDRAALALVTLVSGAVAALGVVASPPASHDEGVVRVVGLGWTGLLRGLDAMVAAPLMLVPLGTRASRAGLASAVVTGACAAVAFVLARAVATAVRPTNAPPRLLSAVAAAVVLTAFLSPMWQSEGAAPGGAVLGAGLVLAAAALACAGGTLRAMALVLGLAASYEPLVLAGAAVAVLPRVYDVVTSRERRLERGDALRAAASFALGLVPLLFAFALRRRVPEAALLVPVFSSPLGERGGAAVALLPFARSEIGDLVLAACVVGGVLAWRKPGARRLLASLLGIVLVGVAAIALRVPASTSRVAAPVLAASCAVHVLAASALASVVVAIARTRVPFAHASAALVVVLELVLPVRAADEAFARREKRPSRGTALWNEAAWGAAPPAAVVLVDDAGTHRRIVASRAVGQMRDDLVIVPTFAMPSRASDRALASEPKLASLYRDIALGVNPEELSLSTPAAHRPLLATFDPRWDRNLARHFVPLGLTARFEPEPRGPTERRRALELFTGVRERLERVATPKRDAELASATATLLRRRAVAIAAAGERDLLERALDDLRKFAPDDPVASTLVRRIVTTKGAIEVKDLAP